MWANRPPIQRTATLPSPIRASAQEGVSMSSLPAPLTFSFAPISRGSSGSSSPSASPRAEMLSFATTAPSSCDSSLDTLTCNNSTIPLEEMVRTLKWDAEPPHAPSPDTSMEPSQPQHATQPSSPVLEAVDDQQHHSVDSILNPLSPIHRKVASCPFGFDSYQPSSSTHGSAPTTPTLETRHANHAHAPSHGPGKLMHSSSNHSHLYHPYARESAPQHQPSSHHHQASNSLSSPPGHGSNSNNAIHRPTVISPASRFLSRKLGPNIPAALAAHSLHNSLPPAASASSTNLQQCTFPPPLSLNVLSSQPEFGSVTQPSHIQPTHSPSQSDGTTNVFVQPASPTLNAALLAAAAASTSSSNSFRTPTGSPTQTSLRNLQLTEQAQQQVSNLSASQPPLHRSPQNHVRHHSYSPTSSASGSPLIKPDFSAFDSPAEGWGRLSAHSPAKHRSLPGTPLHRPHSSYTVPPTPNAKLSKSARNSRRPSTERVLLDTSAMLIDYSMLHLPPTSIPILSPLPTNPSFLEMIVSTEELGVGSFGEVCKVELNNSQPFASQLSLHMNQIHAQPLSSGSSSVGNSAPASPFFQAHQLSLPSTLSSIASTSAASSVASNEAAPSPSSSSPPLYEFALKKTRAPFATIQERQRMLMKYIHLFEFIHKLRGLCVERQSLLSQGLPIQTFNGVDLLSFVDPQTFFPQHMVFHSHLWQENSKFHCLMELCERGDLTTYWYQPTMEELKVLEREREEEMRSYPYDPHYDDDSEDNNVAMSDAAASTDSAQRAPVSALSETVMWRLLLEMSSVLALMHACNFYHCDIKPQQIFVTEDERFKLGDVDSCVMLHDRAAQMAAQQLPSLHAPPIHLSVPSASPGASNAPNSAVASPSSSPTPMSAGLGSGSSNAGNATVAAIMNMELLEQLEEGDGLWSAPELLHTMHNLTDKCDVYSLGASVYAILNDEILQKDEMGSIHLSFSHLKCPISTTLKTTLQEMTSTNPEQRPTALNVLQLAQNMLQNPLPPSELKVDWSK